MAIVSDFQYPKMFSISIARAFIAWSTSTYKTFAFIAKFKIALWPVDQARGSIIFLLLCHVVILNTRLGSMKLVVDCFYLSTWNKEKEVYISWEQNCHSSVSYNRYVIFVPWLPDFGTFCQETFLCVWDF